MLHINIGIKQKLFMLILKKSDTAIWNLLVEVLKTNLLNIKFQLETWFQKYCICYSIFLWQIKNAPLRVAP